MSWKAVGFVQQVQDINHNLSYLMRTIAKQLKVTERRSSSEETLNVLAEIVFTGSFSRMTYVVVIGQE